MITLLQKGTYDGILPAPNAWTPLPERQTTRIANKIQKTDLERDILERAKLWGTDQRGY